ncbi:MAG TPA: hypothetical protein VH643_22635 [Gemmataceae bacterium]|jgi:hypothetical protein
MESRTSALFVALLLLFGAALVVLIAEDHASHLRDDRSEQFQHLVGGLGFGPAVDLAGCAFAFDPRLDGGCRQDDGPIPGGACFCPRHAGSIFFYPPLEQGVPLPGERDGDALSP